MKFFYMIPGVLLSAVAFAQEATTTTTNYNSSLPSAMAYLAAGLGIGLAVIGGATGQGKAAASALEGIGRNPQSVDKMNTPLILSLALIEFQTILAFVVAFLLTQK